MVFASVPSRDYLDGHLQVSLILSKRERQGSMYTSDQAKVQLDLDPDMILTTMKRLPIRLTVFPCRRWFLFGRRGWRVTFSILHEQSKPLRVSRFFTSFEQFCTLAGIAPYDQLWQCHKREAGDTQGDWFPFMMF
jgi:glucose-6-phosphate isomerase